MSMDWAIFIRAIGIIIGLIIEYYLIKAAVKNGIMDAKQKIKIEEKENGSTKIFDHMNGR